ncbi:hypothetical protein [Streptacidiphilus sp. EB103A]|uniref:hypothetical protein n=1 Tax=Streptacidiphilus sp. EB103A TaxID=3156275 RepID=UPI0035112823
MTSSDLDRFSNLSADLDTLADSPAPASTLDLGLALRTGRRRLRRRRAVRAGAVCSLALAVGFGAIALPGEGVLGGGGRAVVTPQAPAAGSDPLVVHATFGWLPASIAGVGYSAGYEDPVGPTANATGTGTNAERIILTLYPAGATPPIGTAADGGKQYRVDTQPIQGGSAYWLTKNRADPTSNDDSYLRWRTPGGRWAEIHAYYQPKGADPASTLRKVAENVKVADYAVPLPVHISALPRDMVPHQIDLFRPDPGGTLPWTVEMLYSVGDQNVSFFAGPMTRTAPDNGEVCTTSKGLRLCAWTDPGQSLPPSVAALGGAKGLLARIASLGMDEKNWTTTVVD